MKDYPPGRFLKVASQLSIEKDTLDGESRGLASNVLTLQQIHCGKTFSLILQIRRYNLLNAIHLLPTNSMIHSHNKYFLSTDYAKHYSRSRCVKKKSHGPYNPGVGETSNHGPMEMWSVRNEVSIAMRWKAERPIQDGQQKGGRWERLN